MNGILILNKIQPSFCVITTWLDITEVNIKSKHLKLNYSIFAEA
jgi:hypothetical protein